jgi:hypothetical protein
VGGESGAPLVEDCSVWWCPGDLRASDPPGLLSQLHTRNTILIASRHLSQWCLPLHSPSVTETRCAQRALCILCTQVETPAPWKLPLPVPSTGSPSLCSATVRNRRGEARSRNRRAHRGRDFLHHGRLCENATRTAALLPGAYRELRVNARRVAWARGSASRRLAQKVVRQQPEDLRQPAVPQDERAALAHHVGGDAVRRA